MIINNNNYNNLKKNKNHHIHVTNIERNIYIYTSIIKVST